MASPPESSNATTRPDYLIRAKSGSLTEKIGDILFRRRSDPLSRSSLSDPSYTLSRMMSKMTVKDIQGARRIGAGGFGEVYVFEHPTKGKVALKQLSVKGVQGDDLRRRALREGDTWAGLKHPNVLQFLGVLETATDLYLVSPYAKNGSLGDYIRLHPDVDRRRLLWEATGAIAFLHEHGIVHGDIKASNLLVSDDVHALLCDFGLARSTTAATSTGLQGIGTVRYQSPELLIEGGGKTFASDVWAFGITISEVLSGSVPFHHCTTSANVIHAVIIKDERPPTLPSHSTSGVSYARLWGVAEECWRKDPAQRPSIAHFLQRLRPTVAAMRGHSESVRSLAFSPDGTAIASGSGDCTVRIWDVESGNQRGGPWEGHIATIWSIAFSPDGTTIASGSIDNTVRVWDAESGSESGGPLMGHYGAVTCLAFSPNGTTIASGSVDCTIRLWDTQSWSQIGIPLKGHSDYIWCLDFSPDGTTIASGSKDHTVRQWDVELRSQKGEPLKGHTDWVSSVAFSPDGRIILSGSHDKTLRLWDVESGNQRGPPLEGHTRPAACVAYSPDGKIIASGSVDRTIRLWDAESGSPRESPFKGHTSEVNCLAFSPDGMTIASGSSDCTIRLWDTDS